MFPNVDWLVLEVGRKVCYEKQLGGFAASISLRHRVACIGLQCWDSFCLLLPSAQQLQRLLYGG